MLTKNTKLRVAVVSEEGGQYTRSKFYLKQTQQNNKFEKAW